MMCATIPFYLAFWLMLTVNLAASDKALATKYKYGECKTGEFYKNKKFHDADVIKKIMDENSVRFVAKEAYCTFGEIADTAAGKDTLKAICSCDAYFFHGASKGGELGCHKSGRAACYLKYSDYEKEFIHKCAEDDWDKGLNATDKLKSVKCDDDEEAEGNPLITSICQPFVEAAAVAICQGFDDESPEPLSIIDNVPISAEDLCSMDCKYVHFANKEPYGFCANICDKPQCFCVY